MDLTQVIHAAIMGIVEGVTEFLPVSSTGHLILTAKLLGMPESEVFEVVIQTGAILAVIILYFAKLWSTVIGITHDKVAQKFALAVTVGFFPAAVLGLLLSDYITEYLFNVNVVCISLIVGGILMLLVEKKKPAPVMHTVDDLTLLTAFKIGLFQCIAMIPGVSRSGATIVGATLLGVDRKAAAEFSFFLAIPTLIGAGVLVLFKQYDTLQVSDFQSMAIGLVTSFITAIIVIKAFIGWLTKHGFEVFAWYRIIAGVVMLALFQYLG